MMTPLVKEVAELVSRLASIPFDQALPTFQNSIWEIADRYGTTGPEAFQRYMDWKSEQK